MAGDSDIKVLLVDDSPLMRRMLTQALSAEPGLVVVGAAHDAYHARELIVSTLPDVIVLDVEMPRMDGLTFLRKVVKHYPVPVIMCSSRTTAHSEVTLEALEQGAADFIAKPDSGGMPALEEMGRELADKIRAAAGTVTKVIPRQETPSSPASCFRSEGLSPGKYLVVVGASTGGTEAIRQFLATVPEDFPPTAIVQHMPEAFTSSFARRLNQFSRMTVSEALDGQSLGPGEAVVARGGVQMTVQAAGGGWRVVYGGSEPVNRHCPSVDVLFDSAVAAGRQAVGLLLTGMGADGARGLLGLRRAGAITLAQDEASCVVYGMPMMAARLGAAMHQCPPDRMYGKLAAMLRTRDVRAAARS